MSQAKIFLISALTLVISCVDAPQTEKGYVEVEDIVLNKKNSTILIGLSEKLNASILPANATDTSVIWTSSDQEIASVDGQGNVSGIREGKASIIAAASDGGYTATCDFQVKAIAVPVTGINLQNAISLVEGTAAQLFFELLPTDTTNQNVNWSSDNTSIVTVNETGMVRGLKIGTANITAVTADGGFSKVCKVTVTASPIKVEGIALQEHELIVKVGDTMQMTHSITPVNATDMSVTWISSNPSILAIAQSGVVTALSSGSASITVVATDGKYSDTCGFLVRVGVTGVTLNRDYLSITAKKTFKLEAQIIPADASDKAVSWQSSNESVATVDMTGNISAIASGDVSISAIAHDGNISATCGVKVTAYSLGSPVEYTSSGRPSFKMRYIPGKSFKIGNDDSGEDTLSAAFWIGETETSYQLWNAVYAWAITQGYTFSNAGTVGSNNSGSIQQPVATINWRDSIVWCNALTEYCNSFYGTTYNYVYYTDNNYTTPLRNSSSSTLITYGVKGSQDCPYLYSSRSGNTDMALCTSSGFRLLSGKEYELASRYISDSNDDGDVTDPGEYYPGNYLSGATAAYTNNVACDLVAVFGSYSDGVATGTNCTDVIRSKVANAVGVYDLSGNVHEFCFDWHPDNINSFRYLRGGAYNSNATLLQTGTASAHVPYNAYRYFGFRIARSE